MQKIARNCNHNVAEYCRSCGAPMSVLPSGLRQCPQFCPGAVWDPWVGWDPAAADARRDAKIEGERSRKPHPLHPVANWLGYGLRQTITLVQRGEVPGITYADGEVYCSSHGFACVSPIPDDRFQRFTLPRATESVTTAVCSSTVASGFIAVRTDIASGRISRHLQARAQVGHSGLMLGVVCFDSSGEVILPPSVDVTPSSGQPRRSASVLP